MRIILKFSIYVLVTLFSIVLILLVLLFVSSKYYQSTIKDIDYNNIEQNLLTGDLVFRRGNSIESWYIMTFDKFPGYSHAGIIIRTNDGIKVAHSVSHEGDSDGVVLEDLSLFWDKTRSTRCAAYRFNLTQNQRDSICNYCMEMVEQKIPFDHEFDYIDDTKLYCTEMIWKAYQSAQIDITEGRRSHFNDKTGITINNILKYSGMNRIEDSNK